jgi:hypothetical protein
MHMPIDIDQHTTDVDKRIRDFNDRKTSPLRALSDKIAERLAPASRKNSSLSKDISYETLQWGTAKLNRT